MLPGERWKFLYQSNQLITRNQLKVDSAYIGQSHNTEDDWKLSLQSNLILFNKARKRGKKGKYNANLVCM